MIEMTKEALTGPLGGLMAMCFGTGCISGFTFTMKLYINQYKENLQHYKTLLQEYKDKIEKLETKLENIQIQLITEIKDSK